MTSALWRVCAIAVGAVVWCGPTARAEVEQLTPHEKTMGSAFGSFTVGSRFETINRIPPLNLMGSTREALLSGISYGRIDGQAIGILKTGYHVGCAVNIGGGNIGTTPQITVTSPGSQSGLPQVQVQAQPIISLSLAPGEVKEVPLGEKEMAPGRTVQIVIRDFHLTVNQCSGPVTLRHYAYVYTRSQDVDDSGAVFGDPTWL
ncbi:MspA family porin [Nocardia sp. CDC159]|uniref:MspA family porin n=1 Tax=Nocardia pulmonis TaxID=2951408 RepID=A0A9X2E5M7_9NOCA|nr:MULTISPECIES: MspA family porin [Nocardia]MCM6773280.1 MspA family porin [Nocardia pulmonis]MCM6786167.1 MspA family porin [Nocardia sp. CDC159]